MYTNITENCKNVIARSSRTFAASFVIDEAKYSDIKKLTLSVPSTANGMISIGGTISNSVEIITEKVNVLRGQKMEVFQSVKLDSDEYEDIPLGHFKITSARTKDSLTTIVASGPLSTETVLGYFSELEYPATTIQILDEISQSIGVLIEVDNLEEIYVESKPEGYTYREVIGFIAAMHAMNAVETRNGTIAFKWFVDCVDDIFTDKTDSPELSNSLFTVNKFECNTGSNTWSKGNGSAGIVISNPLMTDAMADYIWEKLQGFSYRPGIFNIKSGTPCVDIWDSFWYNNERVVATELQYVYDGGLQNTYKSSGETEASDRYKGPMATALERYYAELLVVKELAVDSMTVDEADIRYARVDQLDTIEANITSAVIGSIDGRYASIEHIQANYVSMLSFDALAGRVADLETDSLTAESGLIKEFQSEITKTNTLIFGAAGGTSIQTEFSNAVIAVLGDAQIKSAMIEDVSADKVKSGSLYTNLVHIYGDESNKLSIVDNTIAISDGTRTRVQIGKDASDDYNMYVWNKSGNLMFDALGLTEDGITRQIIRDEVVKDDANINASKLDIDSLFTEINGSSNTIKSTKVYFDSEKQTLDAVFESMTTTVEGLQTTQSSQGTQITAIQGQISSKIWQQDITTAVDEVEGDVSALSTQYSSLNQTVTGLSSTVGSHTTQINSLDTRVDTTESNYTQLSNKFSWMVKSGTSATNFTLTERMAELTAEIVSLNADVKVNGDMIVDGSITAKKIDVEDLFAQDITATGTITGLTLVGTTVNAIDIRLDIPSGTGSALSIYNGAQSHSLYSAEYIRFYDDTNNLQRMWVEGWKGETHYYNASGTEFVNISGDGGITIGDANVAAGSADYLTVHGGSNTQWLTVKGMLYGSYASFSGTVKGAAVKTEAGADLDELNSKFVVIDTYTLSSAGSWTVAYPTGFTSSNSVIIATYVMAYPNMWYYDLEDTNRSIYWGDNVIGGYQNEKYEYPNCSYRIVLMKL